MGSVIKVLFCPVLDVLNGGILPIKQSEELEKNTENSKNVLENIITAQITERYDPKRT